MEELLARIIADDREAFTLLYSQLYPRLYRYLLVVTKSPSLCEEVLQEVFIKLWIKRHSLAAVRALDHFVFRMAKNQLFDLNKKNDRVVNQAEVEPVGKSTEDSVFQDLVLKEYHQLAHTAIAALPETRRKIFLMNAQEDLSAREIAEQLNMPVSTVKKHLYDANHFIRDYLRDHGGVALLLLAFGIKFL